MVRKDANYEQNDSAGEIQLVIFTLGKEEFGVDISQVREIIRRREVTKIPDAARYVEGVINLRGQVTTIMNLRQRFGLENKKDQHNDKIIILELANNTIGVEVDDVTEVLRLSRDDIDRTPTMIKNKIESDYIYGVGKLQDRLLILLDLKKIFNQEELVEAEKVDPDRSDMVETHDTVVAGRKKNGNPTLKAQSLSA